jgi:putative DNA primase/helicase
MSLLSGDGSEVRSRLMDCGLSISANSRARQHFLQYLLAAKPDGHVLCVNQLGWHDGAFVLPDEVISAGECNRALLLQNVDRTANKFKTSGTLEEWQDQIAKYCAGNSRLMFSVCTSFAAALLPIAEETSGGFHIYGTSSTGKTTALLVAGSVWGGDARKGFLETWRATANGLEAVAELHNHSLLLLDEVSQVNPHEIGEVIYSLSNGFGKSRMNKNTTARRKVEWNLLFFSSGEKTLEQIMQSVNQRIFGGQEARFVNIEADAKADNGIFEHLHGFESGNDLAKHLSSASRRYYGTAIRRFLHLVCEHEKDVRIQIREAREYFNNKLRYRDASGEVYRVASRFALVAAAGLIACDFAVAKWDKRDLIKCIESMFDEWLESRGTIGSFDTARGVQQVLSFIAQHGSSRFQSATDTFLRIPNRAGFKRDNQEGETEYWILPEVFEGEICRGFRAVSVAKELERLGHLRRGAEKKYLARKESLPELGRRRVYVVVYEDARENDDIAKQEIPF